MVRILFPSVLVLHGLVHLMGFSKEWNLGPQGRLTGKTLINLSGNSRKVSGIFWLITCILLMGATALYVIGEERFWIPTAIALVVSQTLIILYWHDAKFGTFLNIIILVVVILSAASSRFNNKVHGEVKNILSHAATASLVVTEERIQDLPSNVQRWVRQSGIIGKRTSNIVHIFQNGSMRSTPVDPWMPFEAEQYFTIDPPAFVWKVTIQAAPVMKILGRDKYQNGHGNMLIKPLGLYTMANSSGKEIDQGTLVRYLAEMVWFPQAAISDYLTWQKLDDRRARVTMHYKDVTASGIYTFDDDGNIIRFEAPRYGTFDGTYRKETWSVDITGHKIFNGVSIGNTSTVTWKLKEGHFVWLKLEVTNVE